MKALYENEKSNIAMNKKKPVAVTGLLAVVLFVTAATLGGFQFDDYDVLSQLISETAAIDAPYGKLLRWAGYVPAGILLTIFFLNAIRCFPKSRTTTFGFFGLAIFYGLGTLAVGVFPCDARCNKEFINPSASQLIHVAVGMLTYLFVPLSLLFVGIGMRHYQRSLANLAILCAVVSYAFFAIIVGNPETELIGLWQRIIEGGFGLWTAICAIKILNQNFK